MIDFIKYAETKLRKPVRSIWSDNGTEFKNKVFDDFLRNKGISHNFSTPYSPPQNGVVERRNRSLCEAARSMLNFVDLPLYFWADAILTACFTQNRSYINKRFNMTPYVIINNRKPNIFLLSRATPDNSWLWHRRFSHLNFKDLNKIVLGDHVHLCAACELGKQSRKSHSSIVSTKIIAPLELLHIDLCGPSSIESRKRRNHKLPRKWSTL